MHQSISYNILNISIGERVYNTLNIAVHYMIPKLSICIKQDCKNRKILHISHIVSHLQAATTTHVRRYFPVSITHSITVHYMISELLIVLKFTVNIVKYGNYNYNALQNTLNIVSYHISYPISSTPCTCWKIFSREHNRVNITLPIHTINHYNQRKILQLSYTLYHPQAARTAHVHGGSHFPAIVI